MPCATRRTDRPVQASSETYDRYQWGAAMTAQMYADALAEAALDLLIGRPLRAIVGALWSRGWL